MNGPHMAADPARILVVDDTEANRDLLVRRLRREGHATEVAANGREALDWLHAVAFDLMLLDIMMPEMTGYELLERVRADPELRHVPVILISALDDTDSVIKGIELGADDHLPKPFNPHILRARVDASLARKRLRDREQMHARSLQREMDIARTIQAGFLPHALPHAEGWDLAAWFQPARHVGGDFYDAYTVRDGRRIVLAVADVCDKGVGAALFMALFRSLLRAQAERILDGEGDLAAQACELVAGVNDYIARVHERDSMFATVFLAILDPASGELVYVNGGHEAPVVCGPGGVRTRLVPTGPAVGMLPGAVFTAAGIQMGEGETLVAFTDGVTDAIDAGGAVYSEERLLSRLEPAAGRADDTLCAIRNDLQAAMGNAAQFDDITLLVLHRAG
ncbi:fused response regulator/phosphatase [Luteimonas sp. MC1572]|uniref:PP2C family protein-serine/threonine phosphatase n=1 Tax=Luteimonas sp. MC1572 TaxID=2799325 RepID=UPI0018F0C5BD|nr:fused response regulator/phosphatase [Luteimonas sp. MC1572]MBJ6981146.1 fused response regulator/phosphatase [Luteimonas sp. MC1572]QQO02479.1 fused response regulator/phosphatase [Luteimonas sp. MC1572]